MKPNKLLRVTEVADLLGCSVATVWAMLRRGQIAEPVRFSDRCTRWRPDDLAPLLKSPSEK